MKLRKRIREGDVVVCTVPFKLLDMKSLKVHAATEGKIGIVERIFGADVLFVRVAEHRVWLVFAERFERLGRL